MKTERATEELAPSACDADEMLAPRARDANEVVVSRIFEMVGSMRYGSVEIVLHDGRVVQIERKEKLRLDR